MLDSAKNSPQDHRGKNNFHDIPLEMEIATYEMVYGVMHTTKTHRSDEYISFLKMRLMRSSSQVTNDLQFKRIELEEIRFLFSFLSSYENGQRICAYVDLLTQVQKHFATLQLSHDAVTTILGKTRKAATRFAESDITDIDKRVAQGSATIDDYSQQSIAYLFLHNYTQGIELSSKAYELCVTNHRDDSLEKLYNVGLAYVEAADHDYQYKAGHHLPAIDRLTFPRKMFHYYLNHAYEKFTLLLQQTASIPDSERKDQIIFKTLNKLLSIHCRKNHFENVLETALIIEKHFSGRNKNHFNVLMMYFPIETLIFCKTNDSAMLRDFVQGYYISHIRDLDVKTNPHIDFKMSYEIVNFYLSWLADDKFDISHDLNAFTKALANHKLQPESRAHVYHLIDNAKFNIQLSSHANYSDTTLPQLTRITPTINRFFQASAPQLMECTRPPTPTPSL